MNELPLRKDVCKELTWDLTAIYKDENEAADSLKLMESLTDELVCEYKGKLVDVYSVNGCLDKLSKIYELMDVAMNYAELIVSVDYLDSAMAELSSKIMLSVTKVRTKLSFVDSEIVVLDENVIKEAIAASNENAGYLGDILRSKPYKLHPEAEKTITALQRTIGAPYDVYNVMKLGDIQFPKFTAGGKEHPLGYSLFEDDYEYENDDEIRRNAFAAFSNKIAEYQNSTATCYNANVQAEKTMADLRGFKSVFDSLLFDQKVDKDLYDRQIDLIMDKLSVHMRKYAKLIAKVHKLDKMTYADLKLPIDSEFDPKVTIEGSKEYILKGLSILGSDYADMINEAYDNRWVDFAKNVGKSTGGFCASPYKKNSYILLNWNDRMSDVFTLAHELGHAGHFRLCNNNQNVFDVSPSTYFIEAPSTCNELIMAHYLLKTNDDKRFRRWVLSSMVSNTYYHNFVTHLLEAAYQREVYKIVDNGGSVQAETLNTIFENVLKKFWGDAVELNEGAKLTWMRQPHYYMGLYSYTYSAGLTIATQMCKRIEEEGETAVADWIKMLKAGGTVTPVEFAKMGKIDITTEAPLLDTIDTIGGMIDEIIKITEEIG